MEQTDSCKCHRHVVLVAALDDSVITNRSARLCDVLDAALVCALDVVAEREEASEPKVTPFIWSSHARFSSLVKTSGFTLKIFSHASVCENIHVLLADVNVDRIVTVCAADAVYELQIQHLRH